LACGDVVAAGVGVAAVVGVAALVGVLDETAAVGVEVVGASAEAVVDEVVVDEVALVVEPELEAPAGPACERLSASRRSWLLVRCVSVGVSCCSPPPRCSRLPASP
jgi:hypothetical protein